MTVTPADALPDAMRPGPDLPPAGQSLFDTLTRRDGKHHLPFPFTKLLAQLEQRGGCSEATPCSRRVLIPLGRSLQRPAAIGQFFQHPRVVVGFDREAPASKPHDAPLLRDRLYLGYQDNTGSIEVISYNEAAGRFEFQLVHDYRAGGTPRVTPARRVLCASCHQNLGPIFSRPLWQESNADAQIGQRLRTVQARFHGIAATGSVDQANALDESTDRASHIATAQAVWQKGCGDATSRAARSCRGALLRAALQWRLSGGRASAPALDKTASEALHANWQRHWSQGLAAMGADIPSRMPVLTHAEGTQAARAVHVSPALDPLATRPPQAVLRVPDATTLAQVAATLGSFFDEADMRVLDRALRAPVTPMQDTVLDCHPVDLRAQRISLDCRNPQGAQISGRIYLNGRGSLDSLRTGSGNDGDFGAAEIGSLRAAHDRLQVVPLRERRPPRDAQGRALVSLELRNARAGSTARTALRLQTADDFATLASHIDAALTARGVNDDLLDDHAFSRERVQRLLFTRLGVRVPAGPSQAPHALHASPAPATASTAGTAGATAPGSTPFHPLCASCHDTAERFPPNFLHGNAAEVDARLRRCAARIYQRLAMWQVPAAQRIKTPMPPASVLPAAHFDASDDTRRQLQALSDIAARWLREDGQLPRPLMPGRDGDGSDYELLPTCVEEPAPSRGLQR
ncbi:MAG: hypothetical protein REI94_14975 [Moraxellaceae bacterium]|nr:hypothetical protein [Moraxellaceae bacterium]